MRTRRTALAGIALAAVASLTLAACSSGGDDEGSESTDAVITAYATEPQNPLVTTNTNEVGGGNIIDLLYAGLISYKADGSQENEVAESIESEDSKVWTVKLKDWKFSDGTPVTAESFVKAWSFGADPDNKQLQSYFYYPIEGTDDEGSTLKGADTISGLKVVDDKTFTITLKQPESDFPLRLGYSAYYPLPESAYGDINKFGEKPVGNGPYVLEKWDHNVEAVMTPNAEYDGVRKAKNGGVTFKFYTDPDSAFSDVQGGNLDVLDQVPPSALTTFRDDDSVQDFESPGSVNSTITIPESLDHFAGEEGNLRRQAISRAIDRKTITEKIFDGTRSPSTDFSAPVMPGYTEDIPGNEVLEFDADAAKKLWDDANAIAPWSGKFQVAYNGDGPGNKEWVEAVVNQLNNNLPGINAAPKAFPTFDELRTKVTDRSIGTAFRTGWQPDYPSIYNYLGPIFGTGAGSNDGDYSNKEFDGLLKKASGALDDEERYQAFVDAQAILFKELPAIPLWNTNVSGAAGKDVENVVFNWQNRPEYQDITKK
ncbi:ABC transporter substrate-binding protein [Aeromicrobium flavum]|uniref:ABC transporter substrate-binding protein n=1 Tax=Aeromicrobium flavum TaxID=416568 RepID=A0A512HXG2_9ACTN|nr:ABC transporter substrate-binding protein [Aeromicrobium flavum]GEO90137.1 ABC transporter substrate-binding protein [Aeromicrobium flavum]